MNWRQQETWNKIDNRDLKVMTNQHKVALHVDTGIVDGKRKGGWPKGVKRANRRRHHRWSYVKRHRFECGDGRMAETKKCVDGRMAEAKKCGDGRMAEAKKCGDGRMAEAKKCGDGRMAEAKKCGDGRMAEAEKSIFVVSSGAISSNNDNRCTESGVITDFMQGQSLNSYVAVKLDCGKPIRRKAMCHEAKGVNVPSKKKRNAQEHICQAPAIDRIEPMDDLILRDLVTQDAEPPKLYPVQPPVVIPHEDTCCQAIKSHKSNRRRNGGRGNGVVRTRGGGVKSGLSSTVTVKSTVGHHNTPPPPSSSSSTRHEGTTVTVFEQAEQKLHCRHLPLRHSSPGMSCKQVSTVSSSMLDEIEIDCGEASSLIDDTESKECCEESLDNWTVNLPLTTFSPVPRSIDNGRLLVSGKRLKDTNCVCIKKIKAGHRKLAGTGKKTKPINTLFKSRRQSPIAVKMTNTTDLLPVKMTNTNN